METFFFFQLLLLASRLWAFLLSPWCVELLLFMRDVLAGCFDRELQGNCGKKWRPRSGVVWPFRFSLQQGAIEYLTPIVAGRVTPHIQELETLACAFVFGGKQTSPFSDWWVGLTLESATAGVRHDQARPGFIFFACSISSERNLVASLVQILEEFSCFFRSLFLLALLLWKEAASLVQMLEISLASSEAFFFACRFLSKKCCKFSTHLGDFSCFRFWSFFFSLAWILWRKSASSIQILGEISVASFEAFFLLGTLYSQGKLLKFSTYVGHFSCFFWNLPFCLLQFSEGNLLQVEYKCFRDSVGSFEAFSCLLFLLEDSCKFSTNVEDFSCFFWSFFCLLQFSEGNLLQVEYKCSRDSVASFEAFLACSFFSRKAASLIQMLKISPASSEAFFACVTSLKSNLLQV